MEGSIVRKHQRVEIVLPIQRSTVHKGSQVLCNCFVGHLGLAPRRVARGAAVQLGLVCGAGHAAAAGAGQAAADAVAALVAAAAALNCAPGARGHA